jgi:hypothetical protein
MARRRAYTFTKKSINDFTKQLTSRVENQEDAILKAVEEAVTMMMDKSDEYVPVLTGEVINSRYEDVKKDGDVIKATFGYDKNGTIDYLPWIYYLSESASSGKVGYTDFNRTRNPNAKEQWLDVAFLEMREKMYQHIQKARIK